MPIERVFFGKFVYSESHIDWATWNDLEKEPLPQTKSIGVFSHEKPILSFGDP